MKPTSEMLKAFAEARDKHKHMPYVYEQNSLILTEVLPVIEQAVAGQIAQKIEDNAPEMGRYVNITPYRDGRYGGMLYSAFIAREYAKGKNDE